MTDAETIEAARRLFASDTPGDKLARRLLAIAERERAENQPLRNLLSPLRDAVLYARAQRRPHRPLGRPSSDMVRDDVARHVELAAHDEVAVADRSAVVHAVDGGDDAAVAEVEQVAFGTGVLVDGLDFSEHSANAYPDFQTTERV